LRAPRLRGVAISDILEIASVASLPRKDGF